MATHDYIISNASGAAVRADLNNALAAIVSNNSNASSPATTYAYQWWADTTTGQLKLRNSANNAWITIFELDGTMLMEDGTVSAPGLAFASDLNTGFFRSAADKINFATGGVERLEIGSSEVVFNDGSNDVDFRVESNGNANMLFVDGGNDAVGIGTSSPGSYASAADDLVVYNSGSAGITIRSGSSNDGSIYFNDTDDGNQRGIIRYAHGDDALAFHTPSGESMRIDSSGRLLVGTSSSRGGFFAGTSGFDPLFQIEQPGYSVASIIRNSNNTASPTIVLGKSRGAANGATTIVSSGDSIGEIAFQAADGAKLVPAASIYGQVDGTPGSNDMPGRLVFSTTADGASSPSEKLRIDSSGNVGIGTTSPSAHVESEGDVSSTTQFSGFQGLRVQNANGSAFGVTADINFAAGTSSGNRGAAIGVEYMSGSKNDLYFATSGGSVTSTDTLTERLRISNDGNVGIGTGAAINLTASGRRTLDLNGNSENAISFSHSGTLAAFLYTSSTEFRMQSEISVPLVFRPNDSEAMRLDTSARLLVGASSSRAMYGSVHNRVQIEGNGHANSSLSLTRTDSAAPQINLASSANTSFGLLSDGGDLGIIAFMGADGSAMRNAASIFSEVDGTPGTNDMPGRLVFSTTSDGAASPTERMRIRNNGTVLVGGTTVVSRSQHVLFEVGEGSNSFDIQRNNGSNVIEVSCQVGTTSGRTIQNFINPNGSVGGVSISGSTTTFETSSDYRLKENIVDLADGINRIKQLSPRRFNFIADANKTVDGFIAHEAQTIVPEAVRGAHNEVDDDGNPVMQGIDQSKLVPLLTAALQEAITKIETLETKVAALEAG